MVGTSLPLQRLDTHLRKGFSPSSLGTQTGPNRTDGVETYLAPASSPLRKEEPRSDLRLALPFRKRYSESCLRNVRVTLAMNCQNFENAILSRIGGAQELPKR